MIGAIIGDVCGSKYEFNNIKNTNFNLLEEDCFFTDDTVCTIAVAKALLDCNGNYINLQQKTIDSLKYFVKKYSNINYGKKFLEWVYSDNSQPYMSFGNGAAMRVSPVSFVAQNIDQVKALSYQVTSITHNDPQAIKGAEAVSLCVFMARKGFSKTEIKKFIEETYYNLDFDMEDLRNNYQYDVSCNGSVPQAIYCFLAGKSFEDCIKKAISIGGDSDTIACITASIAQGYYVVPNIIKQLTLQKLPQEFVDIYYQFCDKFNNLW